MYTCTGGGARNGVNMAEGREEDRGGGGGGRGGGGGGGGEKIGRKEKVDDTLYVMQ